MANFRKGRVQQEILRLASQILQNEINDPRVKEVTITEVDLTGDLQNATIYYVTRQTLASEREKAQLALNKATGLVRKLLGQQLTTYKTPEIVFKLDTSDDYGRKIDEIFASLNDNTGDDITFE